MLFSDTTFIGIDPTAGVRPFVYAAIDHDGKLLAMGQGTIDAVLAFAAGQRKAIVAVCAPRKPNQGLMTKPEVRQELTPQPLPGRWMNFRMAEYQIRRYNIRIPQTRGEEEDCPKWMQMGFSLYRRLEKFGYMAYPQESAECQSMEVYPHASFTVMLGVLPFRKHTLEGRLQRQLILFERDVSVPDPMRYFRKITRHRLLNGILPQEDLYSAYELDALVAAYTAWTAAVHPDQVRLFGDLNEGQVVVPCAELKDRYL